MRDVNISAIDPSFLAALDADAAVANILIDPRLPTRAGTIPLREVDKIMVEVGENRPCIWWFK